MDQESGALLILLAVYAATIHLAGPRWVSQAMEPLSRHLGLPDVGMSDPEILSAFRRRCRAREAGTLAALAVVAVLVVLLRQGDAATRAWRIATLTLILGSLGQALVTGVTGAPTRERVATVHRRELADYVAPLDRVCATLAVVPLALALPVSAVAVHLGHGATAGVALGVQVAAVVLWLGARASALRTVHRSFVASDVLVAAWFEGLRLQTLRELVSTRTWLTLTAAATTPLLLLPERHGVRLTGAPATAAWVVAALAAADAVAWAWAGLTDLGYRWYRTHAGQELPL